MLNTRSGNEPYERPLTPPQTHAGFISPINTPQGSPSKNKVPPGATGLVNVFDNAMRLTPSSPSKSGFGKSPLSPGRGQVDDLTAYNEGREESVRPGSPTRLSNKENAPIPGLRLGKEANTLSHAAMSRREQYQTGDRMEAGLRKPQAQIRGLTAEELEKLQQPKVKRLANVTQLC